jgi:hypothetical protein
MADDAIRCPYHKLPKTKCMPPSINGRVGMWEKLLSNDTHIIFYQKR